MKFNGVILNLHHCACYIDASRFNSGQYDSIMNVQQVPGFRRSYHWKRTVVVMLIFPSLAALTAPGHLSLWEPRVATHDDVIKWKHFPRYRPFVRGIHRSPVNSPHTGQWRGTLVFSWIYGWTNGWINNRDVGDLRRHCANYDVTIMRISIIITLGSHLLVVGVHVTL